MISANATYVKVYLYGLAKGYEGEEDVSNAAIAEALDILETDVSKAWRYWKKVGLVHSEGKGVLVFDAISSPETKPEKPITYIGNKNTKKFHLPSCYTLPKEKNRVYFSVRSRAISRNFKPCQNCKP
jgi:hypothetical protein